MVAGEDAVVPLILRLLLVDEDPPEDVALHLGVLQELLLDLDVELRQLLVVLLGLVLGYREDVLYVVEVVVNRVREANTDRRGVDFEQDLGQALELLILALSLDLDLLLVRPQLQAELDNLGSFY